MRHSQRGPGSLVRRHAFLMVRHGLLTAWFVVVGALVALYRGLGALNARFRYGEEPRGDSSVR